MIYPFIHRSLTINRNGVDMYDGIAVVTLIVSLFENMSGKLDSGIV